ncbi:MAG: glycosyltransferase family 2 protein [Candidatus Aenigmarchaeota archaeon]|nr:glycosyltransferase family 2 protein [Candidatus Aenigmarchaeota archaeon]
MLLIDAIFLVLIVISLYFTFLFVIAFYENRKKIGAIPKIKKLPSISILVPCHNEEDVIGGAIENLKALDYPKRLLEIIVVDDGSTDKTAEIAKRSGVRVLSKKKGGKASALNYGLKFAKGEIVACVDADSYPENDTLLKSVPFFAEDKVAAVTTKILVKNNEKLLGRLQEIEYAMISWSRKILEFMESIYATPGPLSFYKTSVIKKLGGFDEKNATEDIEIAWRLLDNGYKIRMSQSKTYTQAPSRFKAWWRQRVRWNIGGIQTALKYRTAMFKKGSENFGYFVVPFFSLSYAVSLIALGVFFYLLSASLINFVFFNLYMLLIGLTPMFDISLDYLLNAFTFFGVVVFFLSVVMLRFGLADVENKKAKDYLYYLVFLTFYIMIFPLVLIDSLIKFAKGYNEW